MTDVVSLPYCRSNYYFLWAVIADRVRRERMSKVLEIGCGTGRLAAFLLDQGVKEYVGMDFSPRAIAMARKYAPRGRFVVDDARTTSLPAEIDHNVLVCTEVLEHVVDDLKIVDRFRPGKRCICSVPNFEYESHVRRFRDDEDVLSRYGRYFTSLDVMTFHSPNDPHNLFFLLDGERNQTRSE